MVGSPRPSLWRRRRRCARSSPRRDRPRCHRAVSQRAESFRSNKTNITWNFYQFSYYFLDYYIYYRLLDFPTHKVFFSPYRQCLVVWPLRRLWGSWRVVGTKRRRAGTTRSRWVEHWSKWELSTTGLTASSWSPSSSSSVESSIVFLLRRRPSVGWNGRAEFLSF